MSTPMTPKQRKEMQAALKKVQAAISNIKKQLNALDKPKKTKMTFSTPSHLYRDDDERFSRNKDGTYSMDRCDMAKPYKYTYARLMESGAFSVYGA